MNRLITFRSKTGMFSFLVPRRTVVVFTLLAAFSLTAFVFSILLGSKNTSPLDVLKTMLGLGTAENALVIGTLRLPRAIVAVLCGAALSVSGSILQGIVRNPLASPDIIGITGGAAFAAVAFITYLAGTVSIQWLPAAAFLGAGLVSIIIYLLAWNKGVTSTRLVLIGIGVAATTHALTMLMIILSPITAASRAYIWLTGSIYGASWENVYTMLPWVAVFIPLAIIYSRNLNVQVLGDDIAKGLGIPVQLHRCLLLFISVALAGSAVAVAGAIGFIGLIAPHIARKLVGPSHGGLIPVAALSGSLLLLVADTIARTAFHPLDIPAGVFTAGVGAPFFLYLLFKNRKK
ncbi:iron ABC transporter permease [Brevibacillus sp. SYP-B805]|uniref:FecCD family ABC transporter permease n=1 Tax=Brevibacillus sp. SYP-B805 TaxID=1578199 RepID=UPI0013ED7869|nr:iron ABC transporter permease [Brevibacillus sp. SYP-B805]NGQ94513.1 iron ABC transporter permease [Brevibacillus sp. SYP-B805]